MLCCHFNCEDEDKEEEEDRGLGFSKLIGWVTFEHVELSIKDFF